MRQNIQLTLEELVSLKGKRAVISGASSGIGKQTAKRLSEAGAATILLDLDLEKAEAVAEEIENDGGVSHAHQLDITDVEEVKSIVAHIIEDHGPIDIWMNIAGIYPGAPTLDMELDDFQKMMAVNLQGTFFCTQQAAKAMIETETKGVIVNTISTTIERPVPGLVHYVASKGGVEAATRAFAKEFGQHGIRVLNVSPTMVKTDGLEDQKEGLSQAFGENPFEAYGKELPLKGQIANPDEIARVMFFATSELAAIVTGSTLYADCGEMLL